MEVARAREMGPERILPNSEEDVVQDRPLDAAVPEEWSGEDMEEEEDEGGAGDQDSAGYYYQPLNQDPDGVNGSHTEPADEGTTAEQLQDVQERIEAMGLFLPHPPPPDSDEEEDPEGAAARRSHASIPMDEDHVELVKRTMAAINLPTLGIPAWAREISDDQWKDMVQQTLQSRQSSAGLRLEHN
ncbi:male-enhanced antigen 1 [Danio rerio]|uniref:Male-enhanced antigen 1 n=1 Tax=Danio rerio TaxID=7955 RepID=A0AB13AA03_DANRE|nr:male-enhanced antigen 1 isoform X1 [Danio rerio]|eukprot:XP_005156553.1 male-enhanced antigen 1 isoform X1 [Danio rerio]